MFFLGQSWVLFTLTMAPVILIVYTEKNTSFYLMDGSRTSRFFPFMKLTFFSSIDSRPAFPAAVVAVRSAFLGFKYFFFARD